MHRVLLMDHLEQAKRHVEQGARLVAESRARLAHMRSLGLDAGLHEESLAQMEEIQRLHVAERDRLRAELAKADDGDVAGKDT